MILAIFCLVFCILAVLIAGALGSLGGTGADLNAIVGGATFVLSGLAAGLGAVLFSGDEPEAEPEAGH